MTRSTARQIAIRICYAVSAEGSEPLEFIERFFEDEHYSSLADEDILYSEYPDKKQLDYIRRLVTTLFENVSEIDGFIERYSHGWQIDRISKTALAVLRCAVCEILYLDDIPSSASINEAVELDKCYDEPDVVSFVNGVLGGFIRGEFPQTAETVRE